MVRDTPHKLIDANLFKKKIKPVVKQIFTMSVFIRIHWLPTGLKSEIADFIEKEANFLTVEEIQSEKWEQGKSAIENGVYSVKVKYDIDEHQNFLKLAGYRKIKGLGALIQIRGMPEQCLQCSKFGHMRKNCPENNEKCTICNKTGHNAHKCWSSRLNNNDKFEESEKEEIIDDDNNINDNESIIINQDESQEEQGNNNKTQKFDYFENKEITDSQIESISDILSNMIKKTNNLNNDNKKRKKEWMQELKSLDTSNNSSILSGGSPRSKKLADEKSAINKGEEESMNEDIENYNKEEDFK